VYFAIFCAALLSYFHSRFLLILATNPGDATGKARDHPLFIIIIIIILSVSKLL